MELQYNPRYPSIDDLRIKAKKRIPGFVWDYLDGGCNEEVSLKRNTSEIRAIKLMPQYINEYKGANMKMELFGHVYDAPFGMDPIGLQGLIWPKAPEILAKAAFDFNIPFVLSTVTTANIETISEITEGKAWFQLYHPAEEDLRDKILKRIWEAQCKVLVILSDVPVYGYRGKEIKSGLSIPTRMTTRNMMQILSHPCWALNTLRSKKPSFKMMEPYMPKGLNMKELGLFMNKTFDGRLNGERIKQIRDLWKGKLVIKGISSEQDMEKAIQLGADGVIVSNHGGRQLDAAPSTISSVRTLSARFENDIKIMMDSGVRSGPDIARSIASGADFIFMGRPFMYGVAALGKKGGVHTISILKRQFQQVMEQIGCERVEDLPNFLHS